VPRIFREDRQQTTLHFENNSHQQDAGSGFFAVCSQELRETEHGWEWNYSVELHPVYAAESELCDGQPDCDTHKLFSIDIASNDPYLEAKKESRNRDLKRDLPDSDDLVHPESLTKKGADPIGVRVEAVAGGDIALASQGSATVAAWAAGELSIPDCPWRLVADFVLSSFDIAAPQMDGWGTVSGILDQESPSLLCLHMDPILAANTHVDGMEMNSLMGYAYLMAAAQSHPEMVVGLGQDLLSTYSAGILDMHELECTICQAPVRPVIHPVSMGPVYEDWARLQARRCPVHWLREPLCSELPPTGGQDGDHGLSRTEDGA